MKRSFKHLYSRFLEAAPGRLHFAAHSHHFWPDATREAQLRYWDDSARLADLKWEPLFSETIARARASIAGILGVSDPKTIAVAPNTHEFVARILSCFEPGKPLNILTTDGEFHSFARQIARLEELPHVKVERVQVEPHATLGPRLKERIRSGAHDLVFLSHVFFNSGLVLPELDALVESARPTKSVFVIDGYHAFCAIPFSLAKLGDRAFYLAGGYKYAQAGEGACFLHVPSGCRLRPVNTGWFAGFGELETGVSQVGYAEGGDRFAGATFDPSGWYRFNAVMDTLEKESVGVAEIHAHVQELQRLFLKGAPASLASLFIGAKPLPSEHGHFLTFKTREAGAITRKLAERNVVVDHRDDRLRFGFGLYQDASDVEALLKILETL